MGNKISAKKAAQELGLPVIPGSDGAVDSEAEALRIAREIGYPVLLKASAGGGGRGMKVVAEAGQMAEMMTRCQQEAKAAFGDDAIYIETYIANPPHIEIQQNRGAYVRQKGW